MRPLPSVGFGLALALAACSGDGKKTDANFDNLPPLTEAIARADRVILYEGLPHEGWEKKALDEELKAKKTFEDHGFPFYTEPLDLKPEDARKLTALFTDPASFRGYWGAKKCGGFHPDYLVEWQAESNTYRAHVCLGCSEVKVYGPRRKLYCDIEPNARPAFNSVLTPYRKNRPEKSEP
jgi:hypothetical protein